MTFAEYVKQFPPSDDIPPALYAARLVSVTTPAKDEPFLYKTYRDLKKADPLKFLNKLESLEKEYLQKVREVVTSSPKADPCSVEAVALYDKLLLEMANG